MAKSIFLGKILDRFLSSIDISIESVDQTATIISNNMVTMEGKMDALGLKIDEAVAAVEDLKLVHYVKATDDIAKKVVVNKGFSKANGATPLVMGAIKANATGTAKFEFEITSSAKGTLSYKINDGPIIDFKSKTTTGSAVMATVNIPFGTGDDIYIYGCGSSSSTYMDIENYFNYYCEDSLFSEVGPIA